MCLHFGFICHIHLPLSPDLHHSPDGRTEGEPQEVDVLLGHAVPLVQRPELGEVGEDAVHLVHVRHHADQQLVFSDKNLMLIWVGKNY